MRRRDASAPPEAWQGQRPRLTREWLALELDPYVAVLALRGDERPVALVGDWLGGGAILASEPLAVATAEDDPFALLALQPDVEGADDGGIGGGWLGFLGYDLGRRLEPVPRQAPGGSPQRALAPPFALAYYDHVLRRDAAGDWWFEALWTPARADALTRRRDELLRRLALPLEPAPCRVGTFAPAGGGFDGHRAAIARTVERIAAGEIFQANVCMRLEAGWSGEPIDLFASAVRSLAPEYAALVVDGDRAVVSASPELFLRRRGRSVTTEPIKGTAARADDLEGAALRVSEKDRAENVMIVDLMRNDLGRVAEVGSVVVEGLAEARPHPGVWHLVSTVSARLREDADDDALLRATFPPGSVTGAPKIRALRVISEVESAPREAYTGAIGVATPIAGLELSVAIRTFEISGESIWLGVGGGIVADSQPESEVAECLHKARPIAAAAGAAIAEPPPPPRPSHRPGRAVPWALEIAQAGRPDPDAGIFTTALVGPGAHTPLGAHLDRLARSARELYGAEPAGAWRDQAGALAAIARDPQRLRIEVVPGRDGLHVRTEVGPVPDRATAPLRPVVLPGGLGAHKWRDRALVDELATLLGGIPLLLDADGCVLEAGHAAVALREGDALIVAPSDVRRLPSLGLQALASDGAQVRCESFDLERALGADAVLLVTALRAPTVAVIEPARR